MATPVWEDKPLFDLVRVHRAVLVVDVVESVRLLLTHEDDVIDRWRRFVADIRADVLPQHGGRMVKSLGDGMLLEFESVIGALNAAMDMHSRVRTYNADRPPSSELHLRAGLHNADIVIDELDVYGAGVNLAARLAALAGPDETIISPEARDAIVPGLDIDVEDLGECYLKHFTAPQRAYRAGPVGSHSVMWSAASAGAAEAVTVAVIPFASHGNQDTAFVGDALADDVIALLSRVPQLHMISRLSTAAFRNRSAEPHVLQQALGCQYAIHGSCAFVGEQVRVRAQLSDCTSNAVVWADAFDSPVAALLGAASPMVERIASAACSALVDVEIRRAQTAPLPSLHSYTILLGAVALMHRLSPRDFERSREMLLYLCERHPRATSPRAWLGKWHVMRVAQGWSHDPHVDAQQARSVIAHALDLEPEHSLALAIDGLVCAYIHKDLKSAAQRYEASIAANPSESLAWLFQSALHSYAAHGELAVECALRAQRLSPLDPMKYYYDNFTSMAMLSAGDYAGAIRFGKSSLRANRAHGSTLRILAISHALSGELDEARETIQNLLALEPDFSVARYLERYPGASASHAAKYADALRAAGLRE